MVFFSYGMTKCGSTLAFEFARTILEQAGLAQPHLGDDLLGSDAAINFVGHTDPERLAALRGRVEQIGHPIVLKSHKRAARLHRDWLNEGFARAHAVYRDPRDMALSLVDAGEQARERGQKAFSEIGGLDGALENVRRQHLTLASWLRFHQVLPVCYEDLAFDPLATIALFARYLGVACEPERVFRTVTGERFTQLNKAVSQRHREEMTDEESARIAHDFGAVMDILIARRQRPGIDPEFSYRIWREEVARMSEALQNPRIWVSP